jgi:MtN3 and saliva related transmembrane protein
MESTFIEAIGLLAGTCTTIAFVPQVLKIWRSKSAKDISLAMFSIFSIGVFLWLIYGLFIDSLSVILANSITLVLASTILAFKFRYK